MKEKYIGNQTSDTAVRVPYSKPDLNLSETDNFLAFISGGSIVRLWNTDSFKNQLKERFDKIIDVAAEVISSLKKNLDYNGYYTAYLLDQISEEEFKKISEKFAITLKSKIDDELINRIKFLFYVIDEKMSPSDLSTFFKIEENIAEEILNRLKKEKFVESVDNTE